MKNTMKLKSLLSFFVPAAILSLSVASCSDYDNGFTESAIKFQEEFRKAYGNIDPEQDWNLSERATVTVSTMKESEVKIYVLRGGEYSLVGDYEGVKGTRVLGFDMVEGTKSILVSDGLTAEQTVPGGVVSFSGTRTTHYGNGGTIVNVSKITEDKIDINGVEYNRYLEKDEEDYDRLIQYVPEGEANLNKVTHDFSYVSTGAFIIYPFHWVTSSHNTIGVYYYDANGTYHEKDVYTIKESNPGEESEITYENITDKTWVENETNASAWITTNNVGLQNNTWSDEHANGDPANMAPNFIQYFIDNNNENGGLNLNNTIIKRTVTGLTPGSTYKVEIDARLIKNFKSQTPSGVTFRANDKSASMSEKCVATTFSRWGTHSELYATSTSVSNNPLTLEGITVGNDGKLEISFELDNVFGNWLSFKNLKVIQVGGNSEWASTNNKNSFGKHTISQGIKVDISAGTRFGMYLKKTDTLEKGSKSYQFFSESKLNDPNKVGNGVRVDDEGNKIQIEDPTDPDYYPCHTSTFFVGDQMYIGFEDWPNDTWAWGVQQSDFDLNDVVFAFDGCKPIIINEDPTPSATWLLVCEDLGGSFDTDYNDVVFKVEHVSGQPTATVTAMAAGGTLASYIFFRDPDPNHSGSAEDQCVGEIHQLLGASPKPSGSYTPINAYSRYQATGRPVTIDVPENWTMAYYSTDTWLDDVSGKRYNGYNMGGFQIRVLKSGKEVSTLNPDPNDGSIFGDASIVPVPDKGDAPYILCLPYTYTEENDPDYNHNTEYSWAWPQELCTICIVDGQTDAYYHAQGQYPKFAGWVNNHADTNYKDWYKFKNKNHNSNLTVETMKFTRANTNAGQNLLTIDAELLYSEKGKTMELQKNIHATPGAGKVTYKLAYLEPSDGTYHDLSWGLHYDNDQSLGQWGAGQSPLEADPDQVVKIKFANTNKVRVTVSQGSDEEVFYVQVTEPRADLTVLATSAQWQNTQYGAWNQPWNGGWQDQDLTGTLMYSGEKLRIHINRNAYTGTGTFTATIDGNGTGSYVTPESNDQFLITAGSKVKRGQEFTVTIRFSGDAQYNAKEFKVKLKYEYRENVKLLVGQFALAYENGQLKLQWNGGNAEQQWAIQSHASNDTYLLLYNIGARKYVKLNDALTDLVFVDSDPGYTENKARTKFESKDGGYVLVTRQPEQSGYSDRYWGVNSVEYGQVVSPRKTYDKALVITKAPL